MFSNIIERFKAVTKEENWLVKILIGGLLLYIPILGHAVVFGFLMDLIQNVKEKKPLQMPKWQNIEKFFMEGIPLALLSFGLAIVLMGCSFILGFLPCLGLIVNLLLSIAFGIILPAILVISALRLRETSKWQTALEPGALIEDLKKDFKEYLPILIPYFIFSFVAVIIGCCGVLAPFPLFYTMVVFFPMLAEVYVKSHSELPAAEVDQTTVTPKDNIPPTPPPAAPQA